MKEQIIVAMEELGISSIVLPTKNDVLPPIGEQKYQLVFGAAENFLDAKLQKMLKNTDSLLHNCVTLSVTLYQIPPANSNGASAYPKKIERKA